MDEPTRERRAEISRRLKAGRWLNGALDEKGRPAPLSPEDLAERPQLVRNGITANAVAEIERMYKDARPMELREIADALYLPPEWFALDPDAGTGAFIIEALRTMQERLERVETAHQDGPVDYTRVATDEGRAATTAALDSAGVGGSTAPADPTRDEADATPEAPQAPDQATPRSEPGGAG